MSKRFLKTSLMFSKSFASFRMTQWGMSDGEGGEGLKHMVSLYDFDVRTVNVDTGIAQTLYLDGYHGLSLIHPA